MRPALLTSALAVVLAACHAPRHAVAQNPTEPHSLHPPETPPPDPELTRRLALLQQDNARLREQLPSFSCHETFQSTSFHKGEIKQRNTGEGEMRALRRTPRELDHPLPSGHTPGPLREEFTLKMLDGKPESRLRIPVYLSGGFAEALSMFDPNSQRCLRFTLQGNRIDFSAPDKPLAPACEGVTSVQGYALLDPDGHPTYMERRILREPSRYDGRAPYAAVSFRQVQLGDQTFTLSSRILGDLSRKDHTGHFEGEFTDCRIFHGSAVLQTDSTRVLDNEPSDPSAQPSAQPAGQPGAPPGAPSSPEPAPKP